MNTAKQILKKLIDDIPDNKVSEVIDFVEYIKSKHNKEQNSFKDLEKASESSLNFWNNDKDDEVWNNV